MLLLLRTNIGKNHFIFSPKDDFTPLASRDDSFPREFFQIPWVHPFLGTIVKQLSFAAHTGDGRGVHR